MALAKFLCKGLNQSSLRRRQVLDIDMAPVKLIDLERFFTFNRARVVTVPNEHSKLGKILGHDLRCMMLSHGQHIVY